MLPWAAPKGAQQVLRVGEGGNRLRLWPISVPDENQGRRERRVLKADCRYVISIVPRRAAGGKNPET